MDGPGERALNHGLTFRSLPPPRIPAPDSITPGILTSHTIRQQRALYGRQEAWLWGTPLSSSI